MNFKVGDELVHFKRSYMKVRIEDVSVAVYKVYSYHMNREANFPIDYIHTVYRKLTKLEKALK